MTDADAFALMELGEHECCSSDGGCGKDSRCPYIVSLHQTEQIKDYLCNTDGAISLCAKEDWDTLQDELFEENDIDVSIDEIKTIVEDLIETDFLFADFYHRIRG